MIISDRIRVRLVLSMYKWTLKCIYIILSFSQGNYARWPENTLDVDGRDEFGLSTDEDSR